MANTTTSPLGGLTLDDILKLGSEAIADADKRRKEADASARTGDNGFSFSDAPMTDDEDSELVAPPAGSIRIGSGAVRNSMFQTAMETEPQEYIGNEVPEEFGESRYDKRLTRRSQLDNLEDFRANEQSGLSKVFNGAAKGAGTMLTTFADAWVGIPVGLVTGTAALLNGETLRDAFSAAVDNPISNTLQDFNDVNERLFPNYRTREEQENSPWQNIFTWNFLGDTLLKNAGFMLGAGYASRGMVGAAAKLSGLDKTRDFFKGLTATLGEAAEGKSVPELLRLVQNTPGVLKDAKVADEFIKAGKRLAKADQKLKLVGSLGAAMGEGRIEAIGAADEYEQNVINALGNPDDIFEQQMLAAEEQLYNEHPEYFHTVQTEAGPRLVTTPEGQVALNAAQQQIKDDYYKIKENIAHQRATVANAVFALNVPLLAWSDAVQFGRFMLGKYAKEGLGKNFMRSASGLSMKDNIEKFGLRKGIENFAKSGVELAESNKAFAAKTGLQAIGRGFTEAQEEMNQSWISSAAKDYGASRVAEFMERLHDEDAIEDTNKWLKNAWDSTKEGFRQSWGNTDDWIEGFAGFLMGSLGMPGVRVRTAKDGAEKKGIGMVGGVWDVIRGRSEQRKEQQDTVDAINKALTDGSFLSYYQEHIGYDSIDRKKAGAIAKKDAYEYEKADQMSFINDIVLFERAGRLNELEDMLDAMANAKEEDIDELKAMFGGVPGSDFNTLRTEGMLARVHDNANEMRKLLDSYKEVSSALEAVYRSDISDPFIQEMTWKTVRLNSVEDSLKDDVNSAASLLSPILEEYKSKNDTQGKTDMEILRSNSFLKYLNEYDNSGMKLTEDALNQGKEKVMRIRNEASERDAYIENIARLSKNPELVTMFLEKDAKAAKAKQEAAQKLAIIAMVAGAKDFTQLTAMLNDDGSIPADVLEALTDTNSEVAKNFMAVHNAGPAIIKRLREKGDAINLPESELKLLGDAWNYIARNSRNVTEAFSPVTSSSLGDIHLSDEGLRVLNETIAEVSNESEYLDMIAKEAEANDDVVREQDRKTDPKQKLPESGPRAKVLLKKKHNVLDSKGNIVTGTYYVDLNEGAKGAVYDRNGNKIVGDSFKVDGKSLLAFAVDNDSRFTREDTVYYNTDTPRPWMETADVPPQKSAKNEQTTASTQPPTPAPGSGVKAEPYIAYSTTPAAAALKNGMRIDLGLRDADGPILLLHKGEIVGELPVNDYMVKTHPEILELREQLKDAYDESAKNANGVWVMPKYFTAVYSTFNNALPIIGQDVPLREVQGIPEKKTDVIYCMYYYENGQLTPKFTDESIVESTDIVMNSNWAPRAGTLYMLVPDGSSPGKYKLAALRQKVLDKQTWESVKDSSFGVAMRKAISDMFEALRSGSSLLSAKKAIEKLMYLPETRNAQFWEDNGKIKFKIDGKTAGSSAATEDELLDKLLSSDLKVRVPIDALAGPRSVAKMVEQLIDTGLLTVNLSHFSASASGFNVDGFIPDGNGGGAFMRFAGQPAPVVPTPAPAGNSGTMTSDMVSVKYNGSWNVDLTAAMLGDQGFFDTRTGAGYTWAELAAKDAMLPVKIIARVQAQRRFGDAMYGPGIIDGKFLVNSPDGTVYGMDRRTGKLLSEEATKELKEKLDAQTKESKAQPKADSVSEVVSEMVDINEADDVPSFQETLEFELGSESPASASNTKQDALSAAVNARQTSPMAAESKAIPAGYSKEQWSRMSEAEKKKARDCA